MEDRYLEVDFDKYCRTCKYYDLNEIFDPCNNCLQNGVNLHSHKPTEYQEMCNCRKRYICIES